MASGKPSKEQPFAPPGIRADLARSAGEGRGTAGKDGIAPVQDTVAERTRAQHQRQRSPDVPDEHHETDIAGMKETQTGVHQ